MKKLLCFTLVLSLMFSMLTVGPLFSFGETAVMDTLSPAYTVSGASCFPGETVELYVAIENNPGIISLRCQISYNDYALELVDIENLSLLEGFTSPPASLSSSFPLRWANALAAENNESNGEIVKLTFTAKESAAPGSYTVSVDHLEARTVMGQKVTFLSGSGDVEILAPLVGDADGDGEVTDWDGVLFERYLAGWPIEINTAVLDVDGDGDVNDWDAIILNRYLAGWPIELTPVEVPTPTPEPEPTPEQPDTVNFTVAKVFSKNMVIQRNEPVKVWGFADAASEGGKVTAEFMGEKASAFIENGEWMITFDKSFPANANKGNSLKVYSKTMTVELTDVLVGDVYFVAGQSNCAYDMNTHWSYVDANDIERSGRNADYDLPIRINYNTQNSPNTTVKRGGDVEAKDITRSNSWRIGNKSNIGSFSAIGYLFARNYVLQTGGEVPVGMIEIDGDGQPLGAFLCNEVAEEYNTDKYDASAGYYKTTGVNANHARFLYNEFMAPFQNMPIAGILWYQGESDYSATEANRYPQVFTAFIEYMRGTHNTVNKNFPVYFIEFPSMYTQPSGYTGSQGWAYMDVGKIRGMMGNMVMMSENMFQVQSGDVWADKTFWNNLHPNCKYEQALRAAKIACAFNGEGDITMDNASGPIIESVTYSADGLTAIIKYKNVGDGLKTIDGSDTVRGFNNVSSGNYAGTSVTGTIVGKDTVEVKLISKSYGVGYNIKTTYYFGDEINLCNSAGIPAGAFMLKRGS